MNELVKRSQRIFLFALVGGVLCSALLAWWASQPASREGILPSEETEGSPISERIEWVRELLANCQPIFVFLIFFPAGTGLFYEIGLLGWVFPGGFLRRRKAEQVFAKWKGERGRKMAEILDRQGLESALRYHRDCQEEDENQIAGILLYAEVCQWVLPLMGFLGTVWGLHRAIGPLKEGVSAMMKALGSPQAQQLREEAMTYFGEGFEGLRVAFDTTLLALVCVVVVGLILERIRRRAFHWLSRLGQETEEAVRQAETTTPIQKILLDIRGALFQPSQDQIQAPSPVLSLLYEILRQGLGGDQNGQWAPYLRRLQTLERLFQQGLFQGSGQEDAHVPLLQRLEALLLEALFSQQGEARTPLLRLGLFEQEGQGDVSRIAQATHLLLQVREEVIRYLNALLEELRRKQPGVDLRRIEDLLGGIYSEGRKETYVQFHHLKPDLHEVLTRLRQRDGEVPPASDPLNNIHMETIDDDLFDGLNVAELEIQVVAVANRASRFSAAGYNRNADLSFVRDLWIDWIDRVVQIRPGVAWTRHTPFAEFTPPASIRALTYHPTADTLFVLSTDGTVAALKQDQPSENYLLQDRMVLQQGGNPFLWFPSSAGLPKVVCWTFQEDAERPRLEITSLGQDPPLRFDPQLTTWGNDLEESDGSPITFRNAREYLCIAGRMAGGKYGMKAARLDGDLFHSVAECTFDNPIRSWDISISPQGPLVVLAVQAEGIYRWEFLRGDPPQRLNLPVDYGNAPWLFLNTTGELLAAIFSEQVRVFSLSNLDRLPWRDFPLESENVLLAASAEDRSAVILSTTRNILRLLLFEEPQNFIWP